jgi:hypothetical protein
MKTSVMLLGAFFCRALGVSQDQEPTTSEAASNQIVNCGLDFGNFAGWTLMKNDETGQLGALTQPRAGTLTRQQAVGNPWTAAFPRIL